MPNDDNLGGRPVGGRTPSSEGSPSRKRTREEVESSSGPSASREESADCPSERRSRSLSERISAAEQKMDTYLHTTVQGNQFLRNGRSSIRVDRIGELAHLIHARE